MHDLRAELDAVLAPNYRITRELGAGGMSRVFLAIEVALEREVVIKVLPPDMGGGVSADRFKREMQLVARLQHPHIVPVLSTGSAGDVLFYVMPFIKGESLGGKLTRVNTLPIGECARYLREVADALHYAHQQGLVHRDVKPDNVLISNGHALVTDFGVAKALGVGGSEEGGGLTSAGIALGTPVYMAPEQAMADPHVDHRADIYAFGVMAYEMLAGQPPFVAPTPQALIAAHLSKEPEPLRGLRDTVPEGLEELVMRCLAKRPADRFQDAAELIPILDEFSHRGTRASGRITTPRAPTDGLPAATAPVIGGLMTLVAAWGLRQGLGLPDWLVALTIMLVLAGVGLALHITRRKSTRATSLVAHAASRRGIAAASIVSVLGLGGSSAAFIGLRAAGIGPFATLLSSGKLTDRGRILVAEFANTTPDTLLGAAITEAMTIDLSQSKVVRLMSAAEVRDGLARMQRDPKTKLTSDVAVELAAREGAKVTVAGEIAPFAGGYALSVRVLDSDGGATLYATRATANTPDEIIPAVEKVSRKVREAIGESLKAIRRTEPLDQVSTSSLEALRLYSRAIREQRGGADTDRVPTWRQAIALDSSFAMAWRGLYADLNNLRGDPSQRIQAMEQMYRYKDRLPQREAMLAEALWATNQGDYEKAIEIYRGVVALWPDDLVATNGVGLYSRALYRFADAEQAFAPAVEAGTATAAMYYNLVTTQIPQGKLDEARHTLELMAQRMPNAAQRLQAAYFLASAQYRFDEAMAYGDTLSRASAAGFRYWGHLYRAEVDFLRGQLAAGRREIAGAVKAQHDQRNRGTALREILHSQFTVLQFLGDTAGTRAAVDAALGGTPLDSLPITSRPWGEVVRTRVALGQLDEARRVIAQYEKVMPEMLRNDDQPMDRAMAQLALAEKRYADAIPLARKGARGCEGCTGDLLGPAFEGLGQVDSAVAAYELAIKLPLYGSGYQNWRPAVVPRAMFRLGELYEKQGKTQLARDRYAAFVDLWEKADPPLQPAVASARARLRALSGERP